MPQYLTGKKAEDFSRQLAVKQQTGQVRILAVGGAVRDMLRHLAPQDFDFVVFGATPQYMTEHGYHCVGRQFPVFLDDKGQEYALARKEIKTGAKHTDFRFIFTPDVTMAEDAVRRDFTCNALYYEAASETVVDLVGGVQDIENKILRHVSNEHFAEDPLRVLRLCRFKAQLDFAVAPETMEIAQKMVAAGELQYLTAERVWQELAKALATPRFVDFCAAMQQCGAWAELWPEIKEFDAELLQQAAAAAPSVKFALLLQNTAPAEIAAVCARLKNVPAVYRQLALTVREKTTALPRVATMDKGELVRFLAAISGNFKNPRLFEDFLAAAQYLGSDKAANERLQKNYPLQAAVHATDIPNFAELPQDERMQEYLWQYRESLVI